jgi:hypothetical protein
MKNLTYDQLIELAPKDRPFQIEVPQRLNYGETKLWAYIADNSLWTIFEEYSRGFWKDTYKGTFTLIDPRYQKPEVLKVGQKVKIMESARECGDYDEWAEGHKKMVGETYKIDDIKDDAGGVYYFIGDCPSGSPYLFKFPHYCVMPVEEEERTLEDILSELSDTDKEIIRSKLK